MERVIATSAPIMASTEQARWGATTRIVGFLWRIIAPLSKGAVDLMAACSFNPKPQAPAATVLLHLRLMPAPAAWR